MNKYYISIIALFAAIGCQNEILDYTCENPAEICPL